MDDKEEGEGGVMLNTQICDPTTTVADNKITTKVSTEGKFVLDEFVIKDNDVHAFNRKSVDFDLLKDDGSSDVSHEPTQTPED